MALHGRFQLESQSGQYNRRKQVVLVKTQKHVTCRPANRPEISKRSIG